MIDENVKIEIVHKQGCDLIEPAVAMEKYVIGLDPKALSSSSQLLRNERNE